MADGATRELDALYKEYDGLRAEVLVRVRARFELLGLFVAGSTFEGRRRTWDMFTDLWSLWGVCRKRLYWYYLRDLIIER